MDRQTLEALVRIHQAELYRYLRYLGASPPVAEDLIQESFLTLFTQSKTPDLRDDRACGAWLRGIARNHFLMFCRRNRTEKVRADSEALERSEAVWAGEFLREGDGFDYLEALRRCVEKLGEKHQSVLKLFYQERKSRLELAQLFELSEESVKSTLRRLRESLGACVRKQLGLESA